MDFYLGHYYVLPQMMVMDMVMDMGMDTEATLCRLSVRSYLDGERGVRTDLFYGGKASS